MSPPSRTIEVTERLDPSIGKLLSHIESLCKAMSAAESDRFQAMVTGCEFPCEAMLKAETVFHICAMAGFGVAMQIADGKAKKLQGIASGN